ncbi:hypothetical protein ABAZ39_04220 [Azospirillum argentinense]|uniref:Intracellular proteinase inhibitor BsuPI domain-containing protein n=2 Tax=Azospirillum argentinense TaxID=2970906 RepID=A0A2K1G0Y5_9PROT|nr:hypothetical protein ABAZ39_04220 [Azospirillum argentinense]EZQ08175.1 hypothetical protein ABAZ39_05645 [Azospirillum argentinense]KAA1058529.1 hypothetical protein FH063_000729 [Azospirillum argentinense]PNQ98427.1 hypothetical protein C1S70_13245 [Azospirillum argentinense]
MGMTFLSRAVMGPVGLLTALSVTATIGAAAIATAQAADDRSGAAVLVSAAIGNEVVQMVELGPKVIQVTVNDRVVYEDREGRTLSFVNAYNMEGRWLVLLQESVDGKCAARFRVLDLGGTKPSVSLPFGTCSDAPKVEQAERTLTVSLPASDGKSTAAWNYRDGMLVRMR